MRPVDFTFYQETFRGKLDEDTFNRLAVYASAYLDNITQGKTSGELSDHDQQRAALALCSVVDAYKQNEDGGAVASESNDGVSVTYAVANPKSEGGRLYDAAALFLAGTSLIFRGVG